MESDAEAEAEFVTVPELAGAFAGQVPTRPPGIRQPAGQQPVAVLEELLAARGERLLHAAVLLAGSHADGEDLLQAALERVFRHWRRIDGDPEGYLRPSPGEVEQFTWLPP